MNIVLIKNISVPVIVSKIDESLIVSKDLCELSKNMGFLSSYMAIFTICIDNVILNSFFGPALSSIPPFISASGFFAGSAAGNLINYLTVSNKHYEMFSHTVYSHPYSIQYNSVKRDKQLCKFSQSVIDDKIVETIKRNANYIIDEAEKLSEDEKEFEIDLEIDAKLFEDYSGNAVVLFSNEYEKPFSKL